MARLVVIKVRRGTAYHLGKQACQNLAREKVLLETFHGLTGNVSIFPSSIDIRSIYL